MELEFAVENLKNSDQLKSSLLAVPEITKVEIIKDRVILKSSLSSTETQNIIEENSKARAVLQGFGVGGSAVAILEGDNARGVVRLSKSTKENGSIVDGTIDGLVSGEYKLNIHSSGDLSQGCRSIGSVFQPLNEFQKIIADDGGRANFQFTVPDLQVSNILGRSIALSTLNGEQRFACGVIARSAGLFENSKKICACDGVTLWDERDVPIAGHGRRK